MIYRSGDEQWSDRCEYFNYSPEIRRAIYTTNAIESLNYQLRKVTKNRSTFSTDEALFKILYWAIRNASEKWTMPIKHWGLALNQFAIEARHTSWVSTGRMKILLLKKAYKETAELRF
jgi:transposase-like protein